MASTAGFESIAELRKKKAEIKAIMKGMVAKETDDNPMSDDDKVAFNNLAKQVDDHEDRIGRMELAYGDSDTAPVEMDVDDDEQMSKSLRKSNVVIKHVNRKERKGIKAARFVVGAGIGQKFGYPAGANYVRDNFEDREVAKTVSALAAGASTLGGATIPAEFREDIIDLLYSASIVRRSGARTYPAPHGNLTIPRITGANQASWVGENADIPASNMTFDELQLSCKRLAAVVPVSNSMIRYSPLNVDSIVLDNMITQLALAEDATFLFGTASNTAPGGIISNTNANNVVTAASVAGLSGSALLQAILSTLLALRGALEYNNVPTDGCCWYGHPTVFNYLETVTDGVGMPVFRDELREGKLLGFDVMKTNTVPTNLGSSGALDSYLIFAQPRYMIIAESLDMITDVSDAATYQINGTYASAFSRDQTVFRLIEAVDFNLEHNEASAYALVPWATANYTANAGIQFSTQATNTSPSSAQSADPTG